MYVLHLLTSSTFNVLGVFKHYTIYPSGEGFIFGTSNCKISSHPGYAQQSPPPPPSLSALGLNSDR